MVENIVREGSEKIVKRDFKLLFSEHSRRTGGGDIYKIDNPESVDTLVFFDTNNKYYFLKMPANIFKNIDLNNIKDIREEYGMDAIEDVTSQENYEIIDEIPIKDLENFLIEQKTITSSDLFRNPVSKLAYEDRIRSRKGGLSGEMYNALRKQGWHKEESGVYDTDTRIRKTVENHLLKKEDIDKTSNQEVISYKSLDNGIFNFFKRYSGNIELYQRKQNERSSEEVYSGILDENQISEKLSNIYVREGDFFKFVYNGDEVSFDLTFTGKSIQANES